MYDLTRYEVEGYSDQTGRVHWSMEMLRRANADAGFYFFEAATLRFFASRVGENVEQGPGGVYFVTSERFQPREGHSARYPRRWTLRRFHPETGNIDTVGEFQKYLNRTAALAAAQHAARYGIESRAEVAS